MGLIYNSGYGQFDERGYFRWLKDMVCRGRPERYNYSLLLGAMHKIPFTWSIPLDSNRAADGISMRNRFALENGRDYDDSDPEKVCSVLEMLVALCIRVEREIMGRPGDDHPEKWFWTIIDNLDLAEYTDDNFEADLVDHKVRRFLARNYNPDGSGGAFPIRNCRRDLRKADIWAQMNAWLVQNYPSVIG